MSQSYHDSKYARPGPSSRFFIQKVFVAVLVPEIFSLQISSTSTAIYHLLLKVVTFKELDYAS